MNILYFDCFSGISGDMAVGALLDLGVPTSHLKTSLEKLGITDEYAIKINKCKKNSIECVDFNVEIKEKEIIKHHHHGRNLFDIEMLIDNSTLNNNIKKLSKEMFLIIADAEAKVHGKPVDQVHFHEVGAIDSIIDIISTAICIDYLKPDKIISSPINTGKGFVKCQHGIIPVPAPATFNILQGVSIYNDEREFELTTPTGAAIIKTLAKESSSFPPMKVKNVGYGCGKRDTEKPNLLRVILGEGDSYETCILEATIDDMNPQLYGHLMDKLFEAGAKDVYYTPVYMKKNRPGVVVTITVPSTKEEAVKNIMFKETTTIGIRKFKIERTELEREFRTISTTYGDMKFKISKFNGQITNVSPEYEDIKLAAEKFNLPMKDIYMNANTAFYAENK